MYISNAGDRSTALTALHEWEQKNMTPPNTCTNTKKEKKKKGEHITSC